MKCRGKCAQTHPPPQSFERFVGPWIAAVGNGRSMLVFLLPVSEADTLEALVASRAWTHTPRTAPVGLNPSFRCPMSATGLRSIARVGVQSAPLADERGSRGFFFPLCFVFCDFFRAVTPVVGAA